MTLFVAIALSFVVIIPTVIACNELRTEPGSQLAVLLPTLMWPVAIAGTVLIAVVGFFTPNKELLISESIFLFLQMTCTVLLRVWVHLFAVKTDELQAAEREVVEKHLRAVRDLTQEINGYAMGLVEIIKVAGDDEMLKRASRPLHALNMFGRFAQQVGRLNLEPLNRLVKLIERAAAPDHAEVRLTIQELEVFVEKLGHAEVDDSLLQALKLSGGIGVAHDGTLEQRIAAAHVALRQLGRDLIEEARKPDADPERIAQIADKVKELGSATMARARSARDRATGK